MRKVWEVSINHYTCCVIFTGEVYVVQRFNRGIVEMPPIETKDRRAAIFTAVKLFREHLRNDKAQDRKRTGKASAIL